MTSSRTKIDKVLTGWLCGLIALNACLGWYCWLLAAFAKPLYRQSLPGAMLPSVCLAALRAPEGLFALTGLAAVASILAILGKMRGLRLLWLVLALLLADIIALFLMAWGIMSPFWQGMGGIPT